MVNPGHPSTGCFRCKERRVKCDATLPTCLRCAKFGVACPGYGDRNKPKFTIVNDTYKTSVRARKAYTKLGKIVDDETTFLDFQDSSNNRRPTKHSSNAGNGAPHSQLILYPSLSTPALLQGAVASLTSLWSKNAYDIHWGMFDRAGDQYENGKPHIKASIEAISLLELSRHEGSQQYNVQLSAVKRYGSALQLINKSINALEQRSMDEIIISMFLAIMFEIRLKSGRGGGNGLSHFFAIMKLMQMKGRSQLSTLKGRQLLLHACISWHAMVIPLPQPVPCPINYGLCQLLTTYSNDKHALAYQLIPLLNRGILLRRHTLNSLHIIKHSTTSSNKKSSRIYNALSQIDILERQFIAWQDTLPLNWPPPTEYSANFTMNSMRSHRIFLDDLKTRCYQTLATFDCTNMSLERIAPVALHARLMVDQICATMPYFVDFDTIVAGALHVERATPTFGGMDYYYHAPFSFPLLIASMVDAGMTTMQCQSITAARKANAMAMRLTEPVRSYPRVLVELGAECEPLMLLCEICGTEVHYASQRCPGPYETAAPGDASLRKNLAAFRNRTETFIEDDDADNSIR